MTGFVRISTMMETDAGPKEDDVPLMPFSEFHIGGDVDLTNFIMNASFNHRVVILQLDGDELAAALWGLENYVK